MEFGHGKPGTATILLRTAAKFERSLKARRHSDQAGIDSLDSDSDPDPDPDFDFDFDFDFDNDLTDRQPLPGGSRLFGRDLTILWRIFLLTDQGSGRNPLRGICPLISIFLCALCDLCGSPPHPGMETFRCRPMDFWDRLRLRATRRRSPRIRASHAFLHGARRMVRANRRLFR
jgi:hypothetical protein